MMKRMWNERGGTLALYTVAMVGMMGMAALAIDLGMLRKARAEAQRGADAAALAGASAFEMDLSVAEETDSARTRAYRAASLNYMGGVAFDSLTEVTVTVIPDSVKVRVKARRAAVATWFARIFGINSFPVGAVAAAEASYASGAKCVKPIAMPDLWDDIDNDPNGNNLPDVGETWLWTTGTDVYHPAHYDSDGNGLPNDGAGTGLGSELRNTLPSPGERDWGRQVVLQPSVNAGVQPCIGDLQGNKCYVPGWWGWWGGTPKTREAMIRGCPEDAPEVDLGVTIDEETGWTEVLRHAIEDVINSDAAAYWDPAATDAETGKLGSVVGATSGGVSLGDNWRASPRVWTVAMVSPQDVPTVPSDHDTIFNNFMTFFVEGCIDESWTGGFHAACGTKDMLVGRFAGAARGVSTGPSPGTMVRILRLVE